MATILGTDLMIFIEGQPVAYSTSAKLSIAANTEDVSSKDSGMWEESIITKFSWTVSTDALFSIDGASSGNLDISDLWNYYINRNQVEVVLAIKSGTSPDWHPKANTKGFSGQGRIVKMDVNADAKGIATYSIEVKGDGELAMVTMT